MYHFHTSDQRESQCIYITYSTGSGMVTRYTHCFNEIYTLVPNDTQCVHLVNLRHCTHLIGVQKSVKSADFFDTVILSLFSYIG